MKFQIFESNLQPETVYVFTTSEWFSSDFDSLQQLCEVGLDDPDKVANNLSDRLDKVYIDCRFLFETDDLETMPQDFPEFFI